MRSNFAQPAGAEHQGVFAHAYTPTDEELRARARAWLAAGGVLVCSEYTAEDGSPGICWHVRTAEGVVLEGLPGRIAMPLIEGTVAETRPGARPGTVCFRKREG